MGSISAQATTFNVPNYVSLLPDVFCVSERNTPFISMLGGLDSFGITNSPSWTWQTYDLASAAQTVRVEGDAPTVEGRTRDDILNVVQIHQHRAEVAYSKQGATGLFTTDNSDLRSSTYIGGVQPVTDELVWQLDRIVEQIQRNAEYSFLQGTFQQPANNSSARQTRGMGAAITTNVVAAGTTDLSRDHYQEAFRSLATSAAPWNEMVIFAYALQKQRTTDIYAYAPESRNVGGVNIQQLETDFGPVGITFDAFQSTSVVGIYDLSLCRIVAMPIPGKGVFFIEEKASTGASEVWQVYGEVGLEYGPQQFHAEITGLSTS